MNAIKRLEKSVGASAGSIEKSFSGIGKGIDKSINTTVQKRINEITGVGVQATKEWTGALADQGAELQRMRSKFNPIFGVVSRYKASVTEIQTAHRLGAISADEMTNAIQRERQATLSSIAALKQRNAALADRPNMGGGSFNTANIAAQFQDIGVTAAMGMSPLQIALQQGTQLSAVFEQMKASGQGAGAGLLAAFRSVISPMSLVTIGVVGLTAAAIQYFSTFMEGSEDSEETLKAQADLIQQVAQKWGDALPSIKAYADEQERIAQKKQVQDATADVVAKAWQDARAAIADTKAAADDLVQQITNMPEFTNAAVDVQHAFVALSDKVADGTAKTEDLQRVTDSLSTLYNQTTFPIVKDLADQFADLADQILKADHAATLAKADAALKDLKANLSPLGTVGPVFSSGGKFIDEAGLQDVRANAAKSQFQIEAERAARAARKGSISDAEKQKKAIDDVIASLQFEQAQLGRTTVEQRVYNELKRAGVDLNSKAGQQIASMVSQIETERAAIEANTKAREAQAAAITNLFEMGADALVSMVDGSTKAEDAIKRLAVQLALAAAQAALLGTGPLAGLFGGSFGMFPGGFGFADAGGFAAMLGLPGRASGGPVRAGQPYIVGEKRPELFIPDANGTIVPRVPSVRSPANQNGGGISVTYAPTIDARGADAGAVARLERSLQQDKATFKGRVVEAVADARRHNINV